MNEFLPFHFRSKKFDIPLPPPEQWPEEWTTIEYKAYPRLPQIPLGSPDLAFDLPTALTGRHCRRGFAEHLTKKEISILLKYGAGTQTRDPLHRTYASAGARYPLEMYLLMTGGNREIEAGLYHYNIQHHALSFIYPHQFTSSELEEMFGNTWAAKAPAFLLATAVFNRSIMKYGSRGYRFVLLEAGGMCQNFLLLAEALSLAACPFGRDSDEKVEKLLDIDGVTESYILTIALGKRAPVDKKDADLPS